MEMDEKLNSLCRRFDELSAELSDPSVYEDMRRYKKISQEVAHLEPISKTWRRMQDAKVERAEAFESMSDSDDDEMKALAQEELSTLDEELETLSASLQQLLIPRDPNDGKDVILEIRAAAGGEEAALFAADLFRMYTRFCERQKWKVDLLSYNDSDNGGYKEVIANISGADAYSTLKYEGGVHRVQRVPATESQGRIHTSTCSVAVMAEAEEVELDIPDGDLRIDTYRASGAGGQHVNRTESAIRITHLPTNTVVTCQDEKSQHKNKAKAMKVLRARLLDLAQASIHAERTDERRSMVGTGDRSERIRTYNYPQNRVTDHRIGLTLYKLDEMMEGGITIVTEPVRAHAQAAALEAQKSQT